MQSFILILMMLNLIPADNSEVLNDNKEKGTVVIEIMEQEKINFQFTIKYESRRKIIKVRSDKSIKSLRTIDVATNIHKGYNVRGSDMIIIPQSDFAVGSYIAEFKFEDTKDIVLVKIFVAEDALANGE